VEGARTAAKVIAQAGGESEVVHPGNDRHDGDNRGELTELRHPEQTCHQSSLHKADDQPHDDSGAEYAKLATESLPGGAHSVGPARRWSRARIDRILVSWPKPGITYTEPSASR
jgi:hypothetical protein